MGEPLWHTQWEHSIYKIEQVSSSYDIHLALLHGAGNFFMGGADLYTPFDNEDNIFENVC